MLQEIAGWVAPAATMIAAMMTAANLGARVTGWGFVVFAVGAIAWVIVALGSGQQNLLLSNSFLLLVDLAGIWRWLGRQARYESGAVAAVAASRKAAAPDLCALSGLIGASVRRPDGTSVATVVDALGAKADGAIEYLVVRHGGMGGVGEQLHALGWHEVSLGEEGLETELDAEALGRRRPLDPGRWPATAKAAGVG